MGRPGLSAPVLLPCTADLGKQSELPGVVLSLGLPSGGLQADGVATAGAGRGHAGWEVVKQGLAGQDPYVAVRMESLADRQASRRANLQEGLRAKQAQRDAAFLGAAPLPYSYPAWP